MATYAIGDLQGCYDDLLRLLDKIKFNPQSDQLWLVGDLVNRGPKSLECLRFIKSLGPSAVSVLGNHDLHLLALATHKKKYRKKEPTFNAILKADDRDELLHWLRHRPLLHYQEPYYLVHAGISPQWDLETAKKMAREVETQLQDNERYLKLLEKMYGNTPDRWSNNLTGNKSGEHAHRPQASPIHRAVHAAGEGKFPGHPQIPLVVHLLDIQRRVESVHGHGGSGHKFLHPLRALLQCLFQSRVRPAFQRLAQTLELFIVEQRHSQPPRMVRAEISIWICVHSTPFSPSDAKSNVKRKGDSGRVLSPGQFSGNKKTRESKLPRSVQFCWYGCCPSDKRPYRTSISLQRNDVAGLQAFGAAFDGEFDALALIQGAETVSLDSREVDENIFAAITGDEAVAFGGVEPFDGALYSFGHGVTFTPVK